MAHLLSGKPGKQSSACFRTSGISESHGQISSSDCLLAAFHNQQELNNILSLFRLVNETPYLFTSFNTSY